MAVTHSNREIMLEVQGANILTEILNKSEIWEWNLGLAVNFFFFFLSRAGICGVLTPAAVPQV